MPFSRFTTRILAAILALFLYTSASFAAEKYGYITKNKTQFSINDFAYRIDSSRNELIILLTATPLSADKKQAFVNGDHAMSLFFDAPSPDENKWQWFPYAVMELTFKDDNFSTANLQRFYLMAYGLEAQNFTDNINGQPSKDFTFANATLQQKQLTLSTSGKNEVMDDTVIWQINIQP